MTKRLLSGIVAFGLLGASSSASALTIARNFISAGGNFGSGLGTATAAPVTFGGGNLVDIFNAAADLWEIAILSPHSVSISFGWQGLGGGTLGVHVLTGEGGSPHRETSGVIRFDSDGTSNFFTDPTPMDNSEYTTFTEFSSDLGGGAMNVGRLYAGATGAALGNFDLFAVALHEIGHALGLSGANNAFVAENGDLDVDVQGPRPFAGASIPTISGAHLNLINALMFPFVNESERHWISEADLIANAEISEFNDLNLDPRFEVAAVPEPGSVLLLASGLGALVFVGARRRSL